MYFQIFEPAVKALRCVCCLPGRRPEAISSFTPSATSCLISAAIALPSMIFAVMFHSHDSVRSRDVLRIPPLAKLVLTGKPTIRLTM